MKASTKTKRYTTRPQKKDTPYILELLAKAQDGHVPSKGLLVEIYSGYIEYMVSKYSKKTDIKEDDDLRAYIYLGLLDGIKRFDHTKQTRFIYFAHIWMKKNIFIGEAKYRFIHLPANRKNDYRKFLQSIKNIDDLISYEEQDDELQQYLTVKNTEIGLFSEFDLLNNDTGNYEPPQDFLYHKCKSDYEDSIKKERDRILEENVHKALEYFTAKEVFILNHSFGLNGSSILSIEDIALRLGVTKVNVAFIKKRVIRLMRHSSIENLLKQGLN